MGIKKYLTEDLWKGDLKGHPETDPGYARAIKAFIIAIKGFEADGCSIRASALTYYTLFAIVPIIALAFGIAKGFDLDQIIEQEVLNLFPNYGSISEKVIEFSKEMLNRAKGGVIVGFGMLFLIFALINVLNNIEETFNHIWLVRKGRTWRRKFTDFISVGVVIPIFLIIANSFFVVVLSQVKEFVQQIPFFDYLFDQVPNFLPLFPFIVTWLALTFLYTFMPNVKVRFKSALLAGLVASVIYHLFQWIYVYFQVGITSYSAIYGSFAAFPLFLIWLQISWMIILFGAELSYGIQNNGLHGLKTPHLRPSVSEKRVFALAISSLIGKSFKEGKEPPTDREISEKVNIPYPLTTTILGELTDAHIINISEEEKRGYQPARPFHTLTVVDLLTLYEQGEKSSILRESPATKKVTEVLEKLKEEMQNSPHNIFINRL